jgi:hypothetical protein
MKECSIEYFEVGKGNYTFLSVGKLHGNENYSKEGLLRAIKEIENMGSYIKYVCIPEVNPHDTYEFNGINLNNDFGPFKSEKTKSLNIIIRKYDPCFIVDHHDDLYSKKDSIAIILLYDAWSEERIEMKIAKKLIEEICIKKKLALPDIPNFPDEYLRCGEKFERMVARYVYPGIYRFVSDLENTLIQYYKKGIVVEVPKCIDKERAIEIHKECDLIIKLELEKLLVNVK